MFRLLYALWYARAHGRCGYALRSGLQWEYDKYVACREVTLYLVRKAV